MLCLSTTATQFVLWSFSELCDLYHKKFALFEILGLLLHLPSLVILGFLEVNNTVRCDEVAALKLCSKYIKYGYHIKKLSGYPHIWCFHGIDYVKMTDDKGANKICLFRPQRCCESLSNWVKYVVSFVPPQQLLFGGKETKAITAEIYQYVWECHLFFKTPDCWWYSWPCVFQQSYLSLSLST